MSPKTLIERIVAISLGTLPRMEVKGRRLFCRELAPNNGVASYDPAKSRRYAIISALGAARARMAGFDPGFDVEGVFSALVEDAATLGPGDFGLLLWLAHRLESARANRLLGALRQKIADFERDRLTTMEVAWLIAGLSVHVSRTGGEAKDLADSWTDYMLRNRSAPSGLVYHTGVGPRRRFPNFASQIYAVLALAMRSRLTGDPAAAQRGVRIADRLKGLQRPNGGWPWLYDAERGIVIEPFEVYSVHQDGMAPMALLELAQATGYDARAALERSLQWLIGNNELGADMIDETRGLIYRSIRRRAASGRLALCGRALRSALGFEPGTEAPPEGLELNAACRPYHLGWILEAWCGREVTL